MAVIPILNVRLQWQVYQDKRNGGYVAVCEPLKLTTEADTWGELAETISEITDALFKDLLQEGSLEHFLREHGWKTAIPIPVRMPDEGIKFDIPFDMKPAHANHAAA